MTASFCALICLFATFATVASLEPQAGDALCNDILLVQKYARLESTDDKAFEQDSVLREAHLSNSNFSDVSTLGKATQYNNLKVVEPDSPGIDYAACGAEFMAMTLFIIVGCGSAMGIAKESGAAWVLQVSFTFGLAITVLACTIGKISGGHINCAVTLGLVIAGKVSILQGLANFAAQMTGSVAGAAILLAMYPKGKDKTGGLGSNSVGEGWTKLNALVGEIAMTFLLMIVVLETTSSIHGTELAAIAIGFAVFLAHSVLIPIDGCSINPSRSFGPALMAKLFYEGADTFSDMWVFWVGPLVGSSLAAVVSTIL